MGLSHTHFVQYLVAVFMVVVLELVTGILGLVYKARIVSVCVCVCVCVCGLVCRCVMCVCEAVHVLGGNSDHPCCESHG